MLRNITNNKNITKGGYMDKVVDKFHALQLFTDTFAAETVHLTNEEIGIYIRLLCFAWTKNTKPFKIESAYRICQCIDKNCKLKVDGIVGEFFMHQENGWTHKRLTAEHEYLTAKYNKRSKAGKLGMEVRYNGVNNKTKLLYLYLILYLIKIYTINPLKNFGIV